MAGRSRSVPPVNIGQTLLSAQEALSEAHPYRRVWRTAVIECIILLICTGLVVLVSRLLHPTISDTQRRLFGLAFALLPPILWVFISYRGARRVRAPRVRLLTVAVLG